MSRFAFKVIIAVAISVVSSLTASGAATAQTLEQCAQLDAGDARESLTRLMAQKIQERLRSIDVDALVTTAWDRQKVSEKLDSLVDRIAGEIRDRKGYWEKLYSTYSPGTAKEHATEVTDRYFHSKEFEQIINGVVVSAGDELSAQLEKSLAETGNFALRCFGEFLSGSYSAVIRRGLEDYVKAGVDQRERGQDREVNPTTKDPGVAIGFAAAVATIAATLSRRTVRTVLTSLLDRLVTRIIGKIAASITVKLASAATVFGIVVTGASVLADLWYGASGVFPQIREELAGQKTKDDIRAVIVSEFRENLSTQVPDLSRDLSGAVIARWEEFKSQYRIMLDLTETVPEFKAWLSRLPESSFNGVARTVNVIVKYRQEKGLVEAVQSGLLNRLKGPLPEEAFVIIEGTQSLDKGIAWFEKFPDRLRQIVAFDIYRYLDPSTITREALLRILATDDKMVARKLLTISPAARDALLLLPDQPVMELAARLDTASFEDLAAYWPLLSPEERIMLVRAIIRTPSLAGVFARPPVKSAVEEAPDRRQAIAFFSQADAFPLFQIPSEILHVADGSVPMSWIYARHQRVLWLAAGILALIVLGPMLLRRLVAFLWRRVVAR
jgi:hypothetical protein